MLISWLWTLGIMGLLGIDFTIFSVVISTFIFGLGIDYSIFITRGLMQEYKFGYKNLPSYKTSILLSALTTIVGIGVLLFAKHPALQSIAALSVIGIVSVVLISYTLQPVLFWYLVEKKEKRRQIPVTLLNAIYALISYSYFLINGFIIILLSITLIQLIPVARWKRSVIHYMLFWLSRSTMDIMFLLKKDMKRPINNIHKKQAIILMNHQSLIDIPISLMLTPKTIVLTSEWVNKSLISGLIARLADFYSVSMGAEELVPKLKKRVKEGYSVFVFPEGTRSTDFKIKRFRKGAFYLADQLQLDIIPILMNGSGEYVPKGEVLGRKTKLTLKYLQ
ncbi:MAG: hypothetical protein C0594_07560 [Marinilabiliales bacterium]|nr:MAG: hypothetical protein C0594_07560 [Marinilabiliales bacterium]